MQCSQVQLCQQFCGSAGGKGIEDGMPRPAAIEAEHELVEVVLEVGLPQSVVDAQTPALEV